MKTLIIFAVLIFLATFHIIKSGIINENDELKSCTIPNGTRGRCVPLKRCPNLYSIIIKLHITEEEIDFLRSTLCEIANFDVWVCCDHVENKTRAQLSQSLEREDKSDNLRSDYLPPPGSEFCGNFPNITIRIFGGNTAQIGEYPWMSLIRYDKPSNGHEYHCSANLINSRYLLTAAHCVHESLYPRGWNVTSIHFGDWDLSEEHDCLEYSGGKRNNSVCADSPVDIPIQKIYIHPEFNPDVKNLWNDIAIIKLATNVNFTNWIQPICLPLKDAYKNSSMYEIGTFEIAGWGKTQDIKSNLNSKMLKATIPAFNAEDCKTFFKNEFDIQVIDNQICAGGIKNVDSCQGDSGGPLMKIETKNTTRWYYYLAGIISFGQKPCGQENSPGVYTKVADHINWILSIIKN